MSLTKEILAIAAIFSVGIGVAQPAAADNHGTMTEADMMTEEVMTEEAMTEEAMPAAEAETISQVDETAETTVVSGTVVDVVGNEVRVRDSETGETSFYDIPRESQIQAGIEEGTVIEMVLMDDMVVAVTGPGGESVQIGEVDDETVVDEEIVEEETVVEEEVVTTEETVTTETEVEEEPVVVQQETETVETTETTAPVRALW